MNLLNVLRVAFLLLSVGMVVYCAWAWRRSFTLKPRAEPRWRGLLAFIGLALGSVSLLIFLAAWVHARVGGGLAYNGLGELLYTRLGLITAVAGLLAALTSKGFPRLPASIISAILSLLWIAVTVG